jgi:hypothetical protein
VTKLEPFLEWFARDAGRKEKTWLMLGKGPSFSKRNEFSLGSYGLLALNHTVREQRVDVAHLIDLDVVDQCGECLLENADVVVMPWIPHVRNRPGPSTLEAIAESHRLLRLLASERRLLWYNLASAAGRARPGSPVIPVHFFSAEAALNLLVAAGVSRVRSLGVDGGNSYSPAFADLADKTLLANGHQAFDLQFGEIAKTILRSGVDFAPLDVETPIRVFVAATEAQMLAVKVLEYSIKKHTSMSVDVYPMHLSDIEIPEPNDPANRPRTPFSFQRFLIPEIAGRRGRAIYLDSDMQVFGDLRRLWCLPLNGAQLLAAREPGATGRRPQFSVMLVDCEATDWDIRKIVAALDNGTLTYDSLMYDMAVARTVRADIDPAWNSLERYVPGETLLLHYTDMERQPWVSTDNPLAYLWFRDLFEAVDHGFVTTEMIEDHIRRGYVRPSLAYQVRLRIDDPLLLPRAARALDDQFVAPYEHIPANLGTPWRNVTAKAKARMRRTLERSALFRIHRKITNRLSDFFR